MMKLSQLKKNPQNPRLIKDANFERLKKSIAEFGAVMMPLRPIVYDENMTVLGGNMRLEACKALGMKEVPDDWVKSAGDLTDEQKREFVIKDNNGFGEYDWDALANEWSDLPLAEWGVDIPDDWSGAEEATEGAGGDEFDTTPDEEQTRVQYGDLWRCGNHRVLCGDSTKSEDVARLMDGEKAVLLHADPPYGMGKEKDGIANDNLYRDKLDAFQMQWWSAARRNLTDNGSAYIWGTAEDLWRLWYCGGLKQSERLTFRNEIIWQKRAGQGVGSEAHRMYPTLSERCIFFMLGEQGFNNNADNYWEGWEPIVEYLDGERKRAGWGIKDTKRIAGHSENSGCHWFDKSQWSMPTRETYNAWQAAANGAAFKREYDDLKREYDDLKREYDDLKREFYSPRAYFDNAHENMSDVWQFDGVTGEERYDHATPKPVAMITRVIKSSSAEGDAVYVPFGGTAPEIIACERNQRRAFIVDIEPKYVNVILSRFEAETGNPAELLERIS